MKIRSCFVSNSSSSSFICGKDVTIGQAMDVMVKLISTAELFGREFSDRDFYIFQANKGFGYGWEDCYGPDIKMAIEERRVVIQDEIDNAIPYYFHELISYLLKAQRLHFG